MPEKLDSGRMVWTLGLWTLRRWTTGHLDSERMVPWTLGNWTLGPWTLGLRTTVRLDSGLLDAWTLDEWTLGFWNLGAMKFFPFLITSISPLLIVNTEFLMISSTLRLMYYGSVERTANDCYNSILLQLIL